MKTHIIDNWFQSWPELSVHVPPIRSIHYPYVGPGWTCQFLKMKKSPQLNNATYIFLQKEWNKTFHLQLVTGHQREGTTAVNRQGCSAEGRKIDRGTCKKFCKKLQKMWPWMRLKFQNFLNFFPQFSQKDTLRADDHEGLICCLF